MGRNNLGREARKRGAHTAEQIKRAIDLHISGKSLRQSAKECGVSYSTLRRYVKEYIKNPTTNLESNYSVQKIFTEEQEFALKRYILSCADQFYGLTTKQCRQLSFEMAKMNNVKVPISWERENIAGKDWLRGFKKSHSELTVRKPEPCSLARATAFNKENVARFFRNLRDVMSRHPDFANGNRVYNLDETATTTVQRPQKVVARKGHSVSKITSGERGLLVTTCCIVNALGQALPPVLVFPRKNYKSHMLHGAQPGSLGLATPTGWMNGFLFVNVMRHFIKHVSASKDNPALLIMDNHESHLSIEAIDLAKSSGVTILTLHPHTTAKLQPLDVGLNGPFKTFYNAAVDAWLLQNPGKTLTIYEIAQCVGQAYLRAMTPLNITAAFKKCDIFPYNQSIFTDIDFLPSCVTDRPRPSIENDDQDRMASENSTDADDEIVCFNEGLKKVSSSEPISSGTVMVEAEKYERVIGNSVTTETSPRSPEITHFSITTTTPAKKARLLTDEPSTSKNILISPEMFRPQLKAAPRKNIKRQRQAGRSLVATDTPEKEYLAAKKKSKTEKEKIKKDLFEKKKKTKKHLPAIPVSSDDEDDDFNCSDSSSSGELFIMESDEEEIVLLNNFFPPLKQKPRPNDYVIVQFKSKNENIFYVAQVLEMLKDEDLEYFVSYLKLKSKALQQFIEPLEPDMAGVSKHDIKYILPVPKIHGSSRRKKVITFPVDMSCLNLRY